MQVRITDESKDIAAAYKIDNSWVIEFIIIGESLEVTNGKRKNQEDGTLLVNIYYIDKKIK